MEKPRRSDVNVELLELGKSNLQVVVDRIKKLDVPLSDVLVVFDFDMTLKVPSPQNTPIVREQETTLGVLAELSGNGAQIIIATAAKPSHTNWDSIYGRVKALGIAPFVGVKQQSPPHGYSTWSSETGKFTLPCWYAQSDANTPMVGGLGLVLSHYEKPAAVCAYCRLYGLAPRVVVFVDDFVVNVWMFGMHFASTSTNPSHLPIQRVLSVWWDGSHLLPDSHKGGENSSLPEFSQFCDHVRRGGFPTELFTEES